MEPLERKDRIINLYLSALLPLGVGALGWAVWTFPFHRVNITLVILSVVTIFFSSYLRIQLPRTKIHVTVSDALIFLALLIYGGEIAVLLAILETSFTSFNLRRQGGIVKFKTAVINVLIGAVATCVTAITIGYIFGQPEQIISGFGTMNFFWALTSMVVSQFLVNSLLVSAFASLKSGSTMWRVLNEYCLNALVLYICGGAMAGVST